jgi:hypothetical protein
MLLQDLSVKSKIPLSTLRRALNKPETPISEHTLRGLELGLGWPEGAADRIMADPEYRPVCGPRPVHPRTSSAEDVVEFMAEFLDAQPEEYRRFRAVIDTNWPDLRP